MSGSGITRRGLLLSAAGSCTLPLLAGAAAAPGGIKASWPEQGNDGHREKVDALQGKEPPAFEVTSWLNAPRGANLAEYKGKVVLISFWATWCGPCLGEIPRLTNFARVYGKKGFAVVAVCNKKGVEDMAKVVKEKRIMYPTGADTDGKTFRNFRVDNFPDFYLVDRAGKLRIADCDNDHAEEAIKFLLNEPLPRA